MSRIRMQYERLFWRMTRKPAPAFRATSMHFRELICYQEKGVRMFAFNG